MCKESTREEFYDFQLNLTGKRRRGSYESPAFFSYLTTMEKK